MNGQTIDPSNRPSPFPRGVPLKLWAAIVIFLVVYLLARFGIGIYTDYLWFQHLDFESVFFTQFWARFIVGATIGIPVAALFVINCLVARWLSIRNILFFSDEIIVAQKMVGWGIWLAGVLLAWLIGSAGSTDWLLFLQYLYQEPFNLTDPIFEADISFYLFSLPVLQFMQSWVILALILALFGSLALYALAQQNSIAEGRIPVLLPHIQLHLSVLGALIFFAFAWGHWLSLFDLMYSERGVAFGASYTDINVTMPALWTMTIMACIAAVILIANIFLNRPSLSLAVIFVWVIAGAIGTNLIPSVVQRYIVVPNELAREYPYIENNIRLTNIAYGLDKVIEKDFARPIPLTEQMAQDSETTLKNIRLWDYRPLQQTYQQLQAIRLYYRFNDIDLDRYIINGELRQVAISARELEKSQLQDTWVTQQLQFTHGYGVVMNPVNEVTREGLPRLWIKDLPPQSNVDLEVTRPEIYYGENTNEYVFVNTTEREFSYPSGDKNVYTEYEGDGGVVMDSYLKRVAFALYLNDINMLLSQEFTADSRVMLHRSIRNRVNYIAPFLDYDRDPYIVVGDDGHLYWIQDAYTTSDRFPYSEPIGNLNYIRNSVKVIMDAYDGDLSFYVVDDTDPLIKTYMNIFPALFKPMSEMPDWALAHLRYPEDLFRIQSRLFQTYHMRDVNVFYNKEDLWQVPMETFSGGTQPLEPYYVVLSLPDSPKNEFVIIQPFTPNNKDNMIAWLAARADDESYGELVVYRFPKQELVYGPLQIEGRIDQNPEISSQITLWDQGGSEVIRGNLLVLPINNALLYVEPLYLRADNGQIPELKRVIIASGDQIVMEETLSEALITLFAEGREFDLPAAPEARPTAEPPAETLVTEQPDIDLETADIRELAQMASDHYEAAQSALRREDWATYGEELTQMEAALEALVQLTSEVTTPEQ